MNLDPFKQEPSLEPKYLRFHSTKSIGIMSDVILIGCDHRYSLWRNQGHSMKNEDIESLISELIESANGAIEPSEEQFRELLSSDLEGPLHFVNFLAFKEAAEYPSDYASADDPISGIEAVIRLLLLASPINVYVIIFEEWEVFCLQNPYAPGMFDEDSVLALDLA